MIDITYCASKTCPEQGRCGRHISNNDLKGKIYSISDFTPMNKGCEFFIECIKKEAPYLCEYCGEELHGEPQVGHLGLKYIHCDNCGEVCEEYIATEDGRYYCENCYTVKHLN